MIRREVGNEYFLITQNDHAVLAGALARGFGNARFAPPAPREAVLAGVEMHDAGWPLHDDKPTLNAHHQPLDVFEVPREIAMRVWSASADRASARDAYAGLLVSLHSLALSIYATTNAPHQHEKFDVSRMQERFAVNKFQHREVERQEELRLQLGLRTDFPLTHGMAERNASAEDDQLAANFRLLQAMDLISLCLCCTKPPAEQSQDVFARPGESPLHLNLRRNAKGDLMVSPWPFSEGRMKLSVPCRRVVGRAYSTQDAFLEAYRKASVEMIEFSVLAG